MSDLTLPAPTPRTHGDPTAIILRQLDNRLLQIGLVGEMGGGGGGERGKVGGGGGGGGG